MSTPRLLLAVPLLMLGSVAVQAAESPKLGHPATAAEITAWDLSIAPDGKGLPPGSGTPQQGEAIYAQKCMGCHGAKGVGGPNDRLAGGQGTMVGDQTPVKTVGSYWPYATTLFDYIRRAMPLPQPQSLSNDEVYALCAYILNLNGIVGDKQKIDAVSLPKVKMPNRENFFQVYPGNLK
jgi:S-disulfanyl-L-cysteine oxidoreductase SoxD